MKKNVQERIDIARSKKICLNCLSGTHKTHDCISKFSCKTCKKHHHTLLHIESKANNEQSIRSNIAQFQATSESEPIHIQATVALQRKGGVLLATAMIGVRDKNGSIIMLRALLDQGSQSAFISEQAAQKLKLHRENIHAVVSGIGAKTQVAKHTVEISLFPRFESDFMIETNAVILPKLTAITRFEHDENDFEFTNNVTLADPSFLRPSEIDIILGAWEYALAIRTGLIKSEKTLIAQNTEFGWIVSGAINRPSASYRVVNLVSNIEISDKLNKFFAHDEFNNEDGETLTEEEAFCESHFEQTHMRDQSGRYIVTIPFKKGVEIPDLGNSRRGAVASLFSMERRFRKDPQLKLMYSQFINEYLKAGHMRRAPTFDNNVHYMPHHHIFKESTTTKLRVVFNGSRKTANGKCLNDFLAQGPMDQNDLTSILIRWRTHRIAFTADIEYRQIKINDSQTHLQRVVWRESENDPIQEYELTTVTYGTANAPYLSIRVLKQLAVDSQNEHPIASDIIQNNFYVDDVLCGADTCEEAYFRYAELQAVMQSACLNLRKWSSNSSELLEKIPVEIQERSATNDIIKTLGIVWNTQTDMLSLDVSLPIDEIPKTKRQLTSEIASLYDPLGYICPVVIGARHILQRLWNEKLDWDEVAPKKYIDAWLKIRNELKFIEDLRIPRWVQYSPDDTIELHGFSDAAEPGYSASIYLKNKTRKTSHIVIAKARVCPIKESKNSDNVTIPRLELCGALLLAELAKKVCKAFEIKFERICLWSDSKIVLDWTHADPRRYKKFIGTRIEKINRLFDKNVWSHVRSELNAADCASRGISGASFVVEWSKIFDR